MAVLSKLVLQFAADLASFQSDMGKVASLAQGAASKVKTAFAALGVGISVAGITAFVKGTIDAADALNDLRTRTGLTGQELLVMQQAAVKSGLSMEDVGDITTKMNKRLTEAAKGSGDAAQAYQKMGISLTDGNGKFKTHLQLLQEVGEKFSTYEDGAKKGILATAALGKGGDRLIPFIEAIKETQERMQKLGISIDEDFITKADKFNDTLEDLKALNADFRRSVVKELIDPLQQLVEAWVNAKKGGADFSSEIGGIITVIKALAVAVLGLATGLAAVAELIVGGLGPIFGLKSTADTSPLQVGIENATRRLNNFKKFATDFLKEPTKKPADERPKKGSRAEAPGISDESKQKAFEDALEKLTEERTKRALEIQKEFGKQQKAVLDARYQNNIVGETLYWKQVQEIQKAAYDAEYKLLSEQIVRQQQNVNDEAKKGKNTKEYIDALGKLEGSLVQRNKLEMEYTNQVNLTDSARLASNQKYLRELEEINIEVMELKGNTVAAALARRELQDRDILKRITVNPDINAEQATRAVNERARLLEIQLKFNEAAEKQSNITTRLGIEEERIQNSLRVGAISELEALKRTGAARQAVVAAMEQQVALQEELARLEPDNDALQIKAEQARLALEKLKSETDLLAQKFDTIFKDSFADAFSSFIDGSKSAKEAMTDFSKSVTKQINDLVSQAIATDIANAFGFGGTNKSGGSASPVGGFFAQLLGGVSNRPTAPANSSDPFERMGNLAAFGLSPQQSGGGGLFSGAFDMVKNFLGSFDTGIDYVPRDGLAMLHKGEQIIPAGESGGMTVNMTVYANDANSFRQSEGQIFRSISEKSDRSKRRTR